MESVFDVFQSVKTLLYLGNYHHACEEANNTDINEEDLSQIVKKYFYIFISKPTYRNFSYDYFLKN